MVRNLDRELKIPVDKCRPTLPTLIAALFSDLSTDKEIKIPSIGEKREGGIAVWSDCDCNFLQLGLDMISTSKPTG